MYLHGKGKGEQHQGCDDEKRGHRAASKAVFSVQTGSEISAEDRCEKKGSSIIKAGKQEIASKITPDSKAKNMPRRMQKRKLFSVFAVERSLKVRCFFINK